MTRCRQATGHLVLDGPGQRTVAYVAGRTCPEAREAIRQGQRRDDHGHRALASAGSPASERRTPRLGTGSPGPGVRPKWPVVDRGDSQHR